MANKLTRDAMQRAPMNQTEELLARENAIDAEYALNVARIHEEENNE